MAPTLTAAAHAANCRSATLSSSQFRIHGSQHTVGGRVTRKRATLTSAQARLLKERNAEKEAARRADLADDFDFDNTHGDSAYEDVVLQGAAMADIKEDMECNEQSMLQQLREHHNKLFAWRRDTHTRTNCTQIIMDAFALQMESMTNMYVQWSHATAEEGLGSVYQQPTNSIEEGSLNLLVVDIYWKLETFIPNHKVCGYKQKPMKPTNKVQDIRHKIPSRNRRVYYNASQRQGNSPGKVECPETIGAIPKSMCVLVAVPMSKAVF
ncbi:hypothetical protein C8R44DRAFT_747817 [Mycena epipterygia]|nr:hypothetical protein C8R44DRAFT_747817 [Mycena epipterygia]